MRVSRLWAIAPWVIGGESGGIQVGAVQMMTPNAAFGTAGAPGAGSPLFWR